MGGSNQKGALKVYPDVKHHCSIIPQVTTLGSPMPKKVKTALDRAVYEMINTTPLRSSRAGIFSPFLNFASISCPTASHAMNPTRGAKMKIPKAHDTRPKAAPNSRVKTKMIPTTPKGKATNRAYLVSAVSSSRGVSSLSCARMKATIIKTTIAGIDHKAPCISAKYAPEHNWLNKSLPMKSVPRICCAEGCENPITSGSVPYKGIYIGSIVGSTKEMTASPMNTASTAIPTFSNFPNIGVYAF